LFEFVDMVEAVKGVIESYKERLMTMPFAPKSNFGCAVLGVDGAVNKPFLTYVFIDMDIAMDFLKDCSLIRRQMTCTLAVATGLVRSIATQ
jgi:hypothetical protein